MNLPPHYNRVRGRRGQGVLPKHNSGINSAHSINRAHEKPGNFIGFNVALPEDGHAPGLGQHARDEALTHFLLHPGRRAFTMAEIAICLAIIGIALVAIIGILPKGMDVQRRNREETIINQDATVLMESIRNGVRAGADLTNYVFAITNYQTLWSPAGVPGVTTIYGYGYTGSRTNGTASAFALNTNANIIGLLSTPEFMNLSNNLPVQIGGGYSNHVVACVHSLSGPAVEKPPQDNQLLIGDSFSYRLWCVNAPPPQDTNSSTHGFGQQLAANLHEVSLTFTWPLLPNGNVPVNRVPPLTQRLLVPGSIYQTNILGQPLYFYEYQTFP
jgi:type II secretory pathway pseudopilin PulG